MAAASSSKRPWTSSKDKCPVSGANKPKRWMTAMSIAQPILNKHLKDVDNGWEKTPKVRDTALRFGEEESDYKIVTEDSHCPTRSIRTSFLDSKSVLLPDAPKQDAPHDSKKMNASKFCQVSNKTTRLNRLPNPLFSMSFHGKDDMDVLVIIRRLDKMSSHESVWRPQMLNYMVDI